MEPIQGFSNLKGSENANHMAARRLLVRLQGVMFFTQSRRAQNGYRISLDAALVYLCNGS